MNLKCLKSTVLAQGCQTLGSAEVFPPPAVSQHPADGPRDPVLFPVEFHECLLYPN